MTKHGKAFRVPKTKRRWDKRWVGLAMDARYKRKPKPPLKPSDTSALEAKYKLKRRK